MTNQKPRYISLAILGLFFLMALVEEAILPLSPAAEIRALLLVVIAFYVALMVWVNRNSAALELEPQPRDCAGRPIFDFDYFEHLEEITAESIEAGLPTAPSLTRPIGRSEAY